MKTALITGAGSGIGAEFARALARKGYRLILVGRRIDRLRQVAESLHTPTQLLTIDLAEEDQCRELLDLLEHEVIDVFINNAGLGICGSFLETDPDRELSILKVNDMAMHILFKGILRKMDEYGTGMIMNVASSAGLLPGGPYMAVYYASKAYVVSLTRAVAQELKERESGVYVCALCPGPVDTEFNSVAGVKFALPGISAKDCVREAMEGMDKRKTIIVPVWWMRILMTCQKILPAATLVELTGKQQKKKLGDE